MAKTFTLSTAQSEQLADQEEKYWLESEEYKLAKKFDRRFWPIFIVGAVFMIGAGLYGSRPNLAHREFVAAGILSFAGFFTVIGTAAVHYTRWITGRENVLARFRSSLLFDLSAADAALPLGGTGGEGKKSDLDARIENNQARIEVYHNIATDQARKSFRSGQIAMAIGLGLVLTLGIIASVSKTSAGAITAGSVAAISAAASAYIGATFLKAQAEASSQLREFFLQPVEVGRILIAERLLEGMIDEDKSKARAAMITSIMAASPGVSSSKATRATKKTA